MVGTSRVRIAESTCSLVLVSCGEGVGAFPLPLSPPWTECSPVPRTELRRGPPATSEKVCLERKREMGKGNQRDLRASKQREKLPGT